MFMVTFNYRGMQEELRKLNKDIGKITRTSAERSEEHRKNNSYCMHTPSKTLARIKEKSRFR